MVGVMTSAAPYPTCWPGTQIIKSTHNAFNWQQTGHEKHSEFAADQPTNRTTLYNRWLVARSQVDLPLIYNKANRARALAHRTPDWPEFRDAHTTPARSHKAKSGIGHNNGTMHGLSKKADKIIRVKRTPGLLVASTPAAPAVHGLSPHIARAPGHGGAYSRAGVQGGDGKIHKARKGAGVAA